MKLNICQHFFLRTKLEHWPCWKPIGVTMKVKSSQCGCTIPHFSKTSYTPESGRCNLEKIKGIVMIEWRVVPNQIWTVSCTFKMGLCLQFALNHILNLRIHPAQYCIVLDLIWISHQFFVTFWGWLNKRVLQRSPLSNCHSESPGSIFFSLFQWTCFFVCFFLVSQKTSTSLNEPQFLTPKIELCWVRSKVRTSEFFIDACGDWAETAA